MRPLLYALMALGCLGAVELMARIAGTLSLALAPTLADVAVLALGVWALVLDVAREG